ncbi:MAG: hypothetical protein O3A36_01430 [bacterium]|nr:hypothetical protein [bacterium]
MEIKYPVGTPVAVFRVDSRTFVGFGTIDAYVPFSEIPNELEEEFPVADTDRNGKAAIQPEDVTVLFGDGRKMSLPDAIDEVFDSRDIPRIRLESGEVTYGSYCFWKSRSEYEQQVTN